jgi:hypothetical protein
MDAKNYIIAYSAVIGILVFSFLFRTRNGKPNPLNLRGKKSQNVPTAKIYDGVIRNKKKASAHSERNLDCLFMYNGEDYDAYQILGAPAGCNLQQAEAAYQATLKTSDPSAKPLLDAAIEALRKI